MRKPTKLTEDQIVDIKCNCIPTSHSAGYSTFARKYGVHHSEIKRGYKRRSGSSAELIYFELNFDKVKAYKDKNRGYELPKITNNELLKEISMTDDERDEYIRDLTSQFENLDDIDDPFERQVYALAMEQLIMTALNDAKISLLMQALATIQEITDDTEIHDIAASAINAVKIVQYEPPAKEQIN